MPWHRGGQSGAASGSFHRVVSRPDERPAAAVEQVFALAGTIDPRYRMMVLLAAFTGLRLGELLALTPKNVDLAAGTVLT